MNLGSLFHSVICDLQITPFCDNRTKWSPFNLVIILEIWMNHGSLIILAIVIAIMNIIIIWPLHAPHPYLTSCSQHPVDSGIPGDIKLLNT